MLPGQLTAHRFVLVGSSFSVATLGEVLEVTSLEPNGILHHDEAEATVACAQGGTGFVRARYRDIPFLKNQIQTMMVICIDQVTESCDDHPRVSLDLERFLDREPKGEANYLAHGTGALYAVCLAEGRYHLQQPPAMPPLMLRTIDAFGEGPYSFADWEFDLVRNSPLITFSGKELRPPWISQVGLEIDDIALHSDGRVTFSTHSCDHNPACTYDGNLVRPGDLLSIWFAVPGNIGLDSYVEATDSEVLQQFVSAHVDFDLASMDFLHHPGAQRIVLYRLMGLEIMGQVLEFFHGHYGLRDSGVMLSYEPYWQTRYHIPDLCFQDGSEAEACLAAEAVLDSYERLRVGAWREQGYDLWHGAALALDDQGQHRSLAKVAPAFDAFAGVYAHLDFPREHPHQDQGAGMALMVRSLAQEAAAMPVVLAKYWRPQQHFIEGRHCEARICESAFTGFYDILEPAILAMLESFPPGQLRAFGVSVIDGGIHFDIREPYEDYFDAYGGFSMNRVGETGYNNPLLNLYLAR